MERTLELYECLNNGKLEMCAEDQAPAWRKVPEHRKAELLDRECKHQRQKNQFIGSAGRECRNCVGTLGRPSRT